MFNIVETFFRPVSSVTNTDCDIDVKPDMENHKHHIPDATEVSTKSMEAQNCNGTACDSDNKLVKHLDNNEIQTVKTFEDDTEKRKHDQICEELSASGCKKLKPSAPFDRAVFIDCT